MQGLISGLSRGDPSKLVQGRAGSDPFASLVATLGARVWLDGQGGRYLNLSGSDIDSATDRSGNSNPGSATGTQRPTYDAAAFGGRGGMSFLQANSQRLTTPSLTLAAIACGAAIWRVNNNNQTLCEAGNTHSTHARIGATGGSMSLYRGGGSAIGPAYVAGGTTYRVVWKCTAAGMRFIVDGTVFTNGAGGMNPVTAPFWVGSLGGGAGFFLNGQIGELVFGDAEWSDAQMDTMYDALVARWI